MSQVDNTAAALAQIQKSILQALHSSSSSSLAPSVASVDTHQIAVELQRVEAALLSRQRSLKGGASGKENEQPALSGRQGKNDSDADHWMAGRGDSSRPTRSHSPPSQNSVLIDISERSKASPGISSTSGAAASSCINQQSLVVVPHLTSSMRGDPSVVLMTPSGCELHAHNFAEAFAQDDKQRLIFRIDALVSELQRERSRNKKLTEEVVPVLAARLEQAEREVTFLRDQNQLCIRTMEQLLASSTFQTSPVGSNPDSVDAITRKLREVLLSVESFS